MTEEHSGDEDAVRAVATVAVPQAIPMVSVLGVDDEVLREMETQFAALDIHVRGDAITISGPVKEVRLGEELVEELIMVLRSGHPVNAESVRRAVALLRSGADLSPSQLLTAGILSRRGRSIRPKTVNQKNYVDAIDRSTVIFGIGPAGTGKTYLAVAKAVQALQAKAVRRIVLTRPAVEAGERLGFLPGTLSEKIDPYLRPLHDALHDMLDIDSIPRLMTSNTIEIAPLAYMRGRTLNDAFVILDEAQNTTPEQMKMFLTRLGFGSTMVITGDVTQVDLPAGDRSGLRVVRSILDGVKDVAFCELTSRDVIRHPLVGRIVDAYADWDARSQTPRPGG